MNRFAIRPRVRPGVFGPASVAILIAVTAAGARAAESAVTYARDVAPIMQAHCAECHRAGQIGPMSLLTYEETRPWAKSIRAAVVSRDMPPWDADPAHGSWANDISMTDEEIATVAAWVDQGAPMGDPADLPPAREFTEGWTIGEPDFVIELPEMNLAADGPDLFPDHVMTVDLPEGKWLAALEVLPGNREVLHHIIAYLGRVVMSESPAGGSGRRAVSPEQFASSGGESVAGIWAAGTPPTVNPPGMGRPLSAKQTFTFNMHYHPNGRPATDRTRVGLHFGEGEMKKSMKTVAGMNIGFQLPPRESRHEIRASYIVEHDSEIATIFPHMHLRGREFTYVINRPDGTSETLLRVPRYDFNWQWFYYPEQPISAPRGSVIEMTAFFDNSSDNPDNPDPDAFVGFGEETGDEMMIGFMDLVPTEGVELPRENPRGRIEAYLSHAAPDDAWMLDFGPMIPAAAGVVLPETGDKASFHLQARSSQARADITGLVREGDTFSGRTVIFGIPMEVTGKTTAEGRIELGMAAAEGTEVDDPIAQAIVMLLRNMKGRRLAPDRLVSQAVQR